MNKVQVADWEGLPNRTPAHALIADVDLVVVRLEDRVSVHRADIILTHC